MAQSDDFPARLAKHEILRTNWLCVSGYFIYLRLLKHFSRHTESVFALSFIENVEVFKL